MANTNNSDTNTVESVPEPTYRAKIVQQPLDIAPPEQALPERIEPEQWQPPVKKSRLSVGLATLGLALTTVIGFMLFDAITTLASNAAQYPIITTFLGIMLTCVVGGLSYLSAREYLGYRRVNSALLDSSDIQLLEQQSKAGESLDVAQVAHVIDRHGTHFSADSYAAFCYQRYLLHIHVDMTGNERLALYHDNVTQKVQKKAREVLNQEAVTAGSMAFISPNNLLQTAAILWVSFRTIRKVAQVYGLKPSASGNWKLMGVLAQNIAAQGIVDLATDEIMSQVSGSLSAKFVENAAEAVAAGALNVRLGKALMKLLK
ncbi:YcjF family protein [Alteromonas sp. KUL49]|uniref:YcjF family protein n=1 Tax=Alteromonas sp. KUL49 TaxID=2480798 RepID=UPI0010FFB013|nr:YcjF family protein [Alteromonas sp. KUL49]GEA12181.1 hypothetical protein KUL49_25560 [Alteromonas sp. KUL49]